MLVTVLWCCSLGRGQEWAMALAPLSAWFQSLPPLPTMKLGPSSADSQVGGPTHAPGPCGSPQQTLLWGWGPLPLPLQPSWVSPIRGPRLYFPAGAVGCVVCFAPPPFLPVYLCANVGSWGLLAVALPIPTIHHLARSASHRLAGSPLHPGFPSLPLLPVWMNLSSLSPWLLDFHAVQFSVSSGCFLFLNCCCPSFGCARRHSVSTYTSILAGSSIF